MKRSSEQPTLLTNSVYDVRDQQLQDDAKRDGQSSPKLRTSREDTSSACKVKRAKCEDGESSQASKRCDTKPYEWQFHDVDQRGDAVWEDIKFCTSQTIEENYCQVENDGVHVCMPISNAHNDSQNDEAGVLFFDDTGNETMTMCFQKLDRTFDVRRISPRSALSAGNQASADVTIWKWYWLDENRKWIQYGTENKHNVKSNATVEQIEIAYLANPTGSFLLDTMQGHRYEIDFSKMVQRNLAYLTERKVRRRPEFIGRKEELKNNRHDNSDSTNSSDRDKEKVQPRRPSFIPEYWTYEEGTGDDGHCVQYIKLDRDGADREWFQYIEREFQATMPNRKVNAITRVQNLELYEAFESKRTWMRRKNGNKDILKKFLYHGTDASNIKPICEQGFDIRISGSKVGTKYGMGTYFAYKAAMAAGYAHADLGGFSQHLLVCKVLVGDFTLGSPHHVRPPPKDDQKPKGALYDSCVNNMTCPEICIIYKSEQAYPEFIIEHVGPI